MPQIPMSEASLAQPKDGLLHVVHRAEHAGGGRFSDKLAVHIPLEPMREIFNPNNAFSNAVAPEANIILPMSISFLTKEDLRAF